MSKPTPGSLLSQLSKLGLQFAFLAIFLVGVNAIFLGCQADEASSDNKSSTSETSDSDNKPSDNQDNKNATQQASTEVGNQIQFLIAKNIKGKAEIFKPHKDNWSKLKVGQKIKAGFILRTGKQSEVKLQFKDGSTILVKPNSEASLEEITLGKKSRNAELYLAEGQVLFNIKKLTNTNTHIAFTTPTATAAIRGTKGGVSTNGKSSLAYLENGKLEVRGHNEKKSSFIGPLEYLSQTTQGFKVEKASSLNNLKKSFKIKENWMKRLKKPVIDQFYSPSKAKQYFQKQLRQKLGNSATKFVEKSLKTNNLQEGLEDKLKNSAQNKVEDQVKGRMKNKKKFKQNIKDKIKQRRLDKKNKDKLKNAVNDQIKGL